MSGQLSACGWLTRQIRVREMLHNSIQFCHSLAVEQFRETEFVRPIRSHYYNEYPSKLDTRDKSTPLIREKMCLSHT